MHGWPPDAVQLSKLHLTDSRALCRALKSSGKGPQFREVKALRVSQEGGEAVADWWKRSPEQWQAGELLLACGATAVAELRAAVAAELGYSCSAGIAHNKACC